MTPSFCSPERYCHSQRTGTCLTLEDVLAVARLCLANPPGGVSPLGLSALRTVVRAYDARPASREEGEGVDVDHLSSLLTILRRSLGPGLAEYTWLDMPFIAHHAPQDLLRRLTSAFRPAHPPQWIHNPRMWLSSLDIEAVMSQYARRTPDFAFLGVFPIDFALRVGGERRCVSEGMCDLDIVSVSAARGCTQIGAVFNMDKHTQGGTHWVGFYAGLDPAHPASYGAFYYDSIARGPPRQIRAFMARVRSQVVKANAGGVPATFLMRQNKVRRQYKNTECGVFAMYFITQCILRQKTFDEICQAAGKDDDMNALRRVMFRSPAMPAMPVMPVMPVTQAGAGVKFRDGMAKDRRARRGVTMTILS